MVPILKTHCCRVNASRVFRVSKCRSLTNIPVAEPHVTSVCCYYIVQTFLESRYEEPPMYIPQYAHEIGKFLIHFTNPRLLHGPLQL